MPDNLSAALWYATKLNWAVVPVNIRMPDGSCSCSLGKRCTSIGKHPTTQHGALDATTDKGQIRDWWRDFPDASVGVACGEINNLIVIDVDPRNEGDIALEVERSKHGSVWLKTLTAETGGGGHHYFYKYTDKPLRKAPKGIDFKSSGFVVVAPSMHPSGKRYRWMTTPSTTLRTFPKWATESQRERSKDGVSFTQVMVEGERDNELTRRAGKYRRIGMTEAAMYRALSADNEMFCEPPLDDRDVRRIARSIARKAPDDNQLEPDTTILPYNHIGNAKRLAAKHGDNLRFANNGWYAWTGTRWEGTTQEEKYAWEIPNIIQAEAELATDEKERKRILGKAEQAGMDSNIKSNMRQASLIMSMDVNALDSDPFLFNVQNGTIDNGQLREHRRADYITKLAPVVYDPNATAPMFMQFLNETFGNDQTTIDYIQRLFGYCLTGSIEEQTFFIFWGTGGNGKSLLIETVRYVMGRDYTAQMEPEVLFREKYSGANVLNAMSQLPGKRLVVVSESARKLIDETLIKRATGGESLNAKFLYHDQFEFYPQFKVILVSNNRPGFSGESYSMGRRVQFIPFEHRPAVVDRKLGEKLRTESAGILNWLIDGMLMWQEQGLNPPKHVKAATEKYRKSEDIIGIFLKECCIRRADAHTSVSDLYLVYSNWCASNRMRARGKITFNQQIEDRKVAIKMRISNNLSWKGLKVRALD